MGLQEFVQALELAYESGRKREEAKSKLYDDLKGGEVIHEIYRLKGVIAGGCYEPWGNSAKVVVAWETGAMTPELPTQLAPEGWTWEDFWNSTTEDENGPL